MEQARAVRQVRCLTKSYACWCLISPTVLLERQDSARYTFGLRVTLQHRHTSAYALSLPPLSHHPSDPPPGRQVPDNGAGDPDAGTLEENAATPAKYPLRTVVEARCCVGRTYVSPGTLSVTRSFTTTLQPRRNGKPRQPPILRQVEWMPQLQTWTTAGAEVKVQRRSHRSCSHRHRRHLNMQRSPHQQLRQRG